MNILLLEDDKQLNKAISGFLRLKGLNITSFYDGEEVLKHIGGYDLYLLDINTPNVNGIDILKYIHASSPRIKVIMLSANINIETIKSAYDNGCYDYLKKPFQIEELYFKIENIAKEFSRYVVLKKELKFDVETKILYKENQQIELTKKETDLLHILSTNINSTVTYEQIEFAVYNNEATALTTVRTLIKRLRDKMGKNIIKTIINVGYKI